MSELGETFRAYHESRKKQRNLNHVRSIEILNEKGIHFEQLSDDHYRVGEYDYWPTTGLFIHMKTKKRNRGVFNLIKKITSEVKSKDT